MKRFLIPLSLVMMLCVVGSASAQCSSCQTPAPVPHPAQIQHAPVEPIWHGDYSGHPGHIGAASGYTNYGSPYGWNRPLLRALENKRNRQNGGYYAPPAEQGPPVQGTLVFPNHPFVRSPRDFFMVN